MGTFYSLSGDIEVQDCLEVEDIVKRFNNEGGELYIEVMDGATEDTVTLQFCGGVYCSYATVTELDDIAQELGQFVVEPDVIYYDCDTERGELYIGPADAEEVVSLNTLEKIKSAVSELTDKDKAALRAWLS